VLKISGVTKVVVTRGGWWWWCHLFFLHKTDDLSSPSPNWWPFYLSSSHLSHLPTSFVQPQQNKLYSGFTPLDGGFYPLDGVIRGGPPSPSDATVEDVASRCRIDQHFKL